MTISTSTKKRYAASYSKDGKRLHKEIGTSHFKMIVEHVPLGKNKKGKQIYKSYTNHVRA